MPDATRFRFRPRFRAVAVLAMVLGIALGFYGLVAGGAAATAMVALGMGGAALGGLYLGSPAWRIEVIVDDHGLEVRAGEERRFRLAWADIKGVTASPSTHTCFVDGGAPERSLLVPGDGAPAPYAIADAPALYRAILAHAPPACVREVAFLEQAGR